ncbi:Spo0E family sporulation regulatory protein-aspartic acid phosphatase [Oceanobacillus arenosus]|uniref:Spo0E family sporulation regulatory protein-aspartic acid phosphatase n=1 Tax=Oceanobacillus arenosus TaxID=1229153 RepID=A0A3D8PTW1_9BACI|nr:aspartyl-phosphate phosphatase Spo0E family protein [Oceanobacillus arenosus]RDW18405.1 Spo0E family sporulation regulatory protein-aspartic acid phosphatase [Oceanobacillus arenosus]
MNMNKELQQRIECLRYKMVKIAASKGLTDIESVKISQELDHVLNHYEKVKGQNDNHNM